MISATQLIELLKFSGDHEMTTPLIDTTELWLELHDAGLLHGRRDHGNKPLTWYRATPLGLRVILAAQRAANEALK